MTAECVECLCAWGFVYDLHGRRMFVYSPPRQRSLSPPPHLSQPSEGFCKFWQASLRLVLAKISSERPETCDVFRTSPEVMSKLLKQKEMITDVIGENQDYVRPRRCRQARARQREQRCNQDDPRCDYHSQAEKLFPLPASQSMLHLIRTAVVMNDVC